MDNISPSFNLDADCWVSQRTYDGLLNLIDGLFPSSQGVGARCKPLRTASVENAIQFFLCLIANHINACYLYRSRRSSLRDISYPSFIFRCSANSIRNKFGRIDSEDIATLKGANLLKRRKYKVGANPFGYEITSEVLSILRRHESELDFASPVNLRNPKTSNQCKGRVSSVQSVPTSKLLKKALETLESKAIPLNMAKAEDSLRARHELKEPSDKNKLLHDIHCFRLIAASVAAFKKGEPRIRVAGKFQHYRPNHTIQMAGRVSETLQNPSSKLKSALFDSIPYLHNYDIASSQAHALVLLLQASNLQCSWLDNYLQKSNPAEELAAKLDINKKSWKKCLYALFFGSTIPQSTVVRKNAILETIRHERQSPKDVELLLSDVTSELQPLAQVLQDWRECLVANHKLDPKTTTNACGLQFIDVSDHSTAKRGKKLASFYLQGLEAAYIHHLTMLSKKYKYTVLSNQHDGLITIGEIPLEAQRLASLRSGFSNARLVEKPF